LSGSATQAGFYYQNNVAALKILDMLRIGSPIRTVELENPDGAKHIDDIIVHYTDYSEYIQIKWSADDNSNYALYGLLYTTPDDKKPSLMKQLATGFLSLSTKTGAKIISLVRCLTGER